MNFFWGNGVLGLLDKTRGKGRGGRQSVCMSIRGQGRRKSWVPSAIVEILAKHHDSKSRKHTNDDVKDKEIILHILLPHVSTNHISIAVTSTVDSYCFDTQYNTANAKQTVHC